MTDATYQTIRNAQIPRAEALALLDSCGSYPSKDAQEWAFNRAYHAYMDELTRAALTSALAGHEHAPPAHLTASSEPAQLKAGVDTSTPRRIHETITPKQLAQAVWERDWRRYEEKNKRHNQRDANGRFVRAG